METPQNAQYPRGIELVGSAIIENDKGEILLVRSSKWHNKWTMPGGHVETGESVVAAQVREAEEETGLKLKPIAVVGWGELIGPKDFHRRGHFVYFDIHCKVLGGELKLDSAEFTAYQWLKPEDALKLDLAASYDAVIKDYIAYRNSSVKTEI